MKSNKDIIPIDSNHETKKSRQSNTEYSCNTKPEPRMLFDKIESCSSRQQQSSYKKPPKEIKYFLNFLKMNLHITELSGREEKDIRSNYDALIDYNSLFNHQPLKFPTCAMSESGRIHFEEVKKIFDFFSGL